VKGLVAGEDLPEGPLGGEGAVDAFDLAVSPGAVRFDEALLGPDLRHGFFERDRFPVGVGVVGEDPLDPGDAVGGEELRRAQQQSGAGAALLVVVDLGVRRVGCGRR